MPAHIYKNPEHYSKNNALQYNFAMKMLRQISFSSNSRILDIGCGDGVITNEMAKIVTDGCIVGTDISDQMIGYANKKYHGQSNLRFLQMDAAKNIFRQQFDIITSFNCLHWVQDQESAIKGISNSAVDGAQIILLLSHKRSQYHLVLDKLCSSGKWGAYFSNYTSPRSFFDLSTYKKLLINSRLEVRSLVEKEMIYFYKTPNELKEFFSAAGSHIQFIPDHFLNDFLNDFVNQYLQQVTLNDNNEIPLAFWCLQIVANKSTPKEILVA